MNIKVRLNDFLEYQKKYETYYLDKKYKYRLHCNSKNNLFNVNEMFDGIETEFKYSNESIDKKFCVIFNTNSGIKYRFDFIEKEQNIYHLAFTLDDRDVQNYDEVTDLDESKEVFGRLAYILKKISNDRNIDEFCIGATGDIKKDKIYKYMMSYVKTWEKRVTDLYDLGWGLYFTI